MPEKTLEISNKLGLHARSAAQMVKVASAYQAQVWVSKDGLQADAKSILDLLTLAGTMGSEIVIRAEGTDAQTVLDALTVLVESKFGEE